MHYRSWKTGIACLLAVILAGLVLPGELFAPPQMTGQPPGIHKFLVEIDGIASTKMMSVWGLESTVAVVEYRQGNSLTTMKIPGLVEYSNIVLRGGVKHTRDLWKWYKEVLNGNVQRKAMVISILDNTNNVELRYKLYNAWPCQWRGPELVASESGNAVEEIEIAIEGFEREEEG